MKCFLTLIFLMSSTLALAEVSPAEVSDMLQQMVKENVISAEEAEKAKIKMKTMNTDQWSQINVKAVTVAANRTPASVSSHSIAEVKNVDLDGAQFKAIQEDIGKILPDMRK